MHVDWIIKALDFVFIVIPALAVGAFCISMVYGYVYGFWRNPVRMGRGTVGFVLAMVIGFLGMPMVDKYIYPLGEWGMAVGWCFGWVLAYKVGVVVAGFKEDPR
jgi:hypothetical protein